MKLSKGYKSTILVLALAAVISVGASDAFARSAIADIHAASRSADASQSSSVRDQIKQMIIQRLRNHVNNKINVFNKMVNLVTALLDKVQHRIDNASAAGKDVTQMNTLMNDSRNKLADAKAKLADINTLSSTASTRDDFLKIKNEFQQAREDFIIIRNNTAKVISMLKEFNSSDNSAINGGNKESSHSASESGKSK